MTRILTSTSGVYYYSKETHPGSLNSDVGGLPRLSLSSPKLPTLCTEGAPTTPSINVDLASKLKTSCYHANMAGIAAFNIFFGGLHEIC